MSDSMDYRAILFHKQSTSARLRFLLFAHDSVCAFGRVPAPARMHVDQREHPALHPAPVVGRLRETYGFEPDTLHAEQGFRVQIEGADARIRIFLVGIDTVDPPFALAETIGGRFIDLTQARGLPPIELQLLRGAYETVLGG
ncbi:MAG: hypothetical protein QNJ91_02255 [Gammaproteobacteria bacterium]|nr:hypothetical protein [Gammaproteobacteria bacterium]